MATTTATLQNLAIEWAVRDNPAVLIDLVKASGILQTALVKPSSHGNKHYYKYWNALPSSAFRAFGTGIVPSVISKDRASIDLWDLSALMEEDASYINTYPNGKAGWLADNLPAFLEGLGQAAANQIIYGTTSLGSTTGFVGLHQYALAADTATNYAVQSASSETTATTSIIAVRWNETDGASLRIKPNGDQKLMTVTDVTPNDPALVTTNTATNAQLPVFAWWLNAYFSLVIPSVASVAVIKKINGTEAPTVAEMNNMLDMIEGPGQSYIYCNKTGRSQISTLKGTKLNLFSETMNYNEYLASWRGVPIILEENISNAETAAALD